MEANENKVISEAIDRVLIPIQTVSKLLCKQTKNLIDIIDFLETFLF